MAVGDQDHGCVAMPVAAMLAGAVHQALDLALGEIASLDCQVYDVWSALLGSRFHADKPCLRGTDCLAYTHEAAARAARPTPFCLAAEPLYGTRGMSLWKPIGLIGPPRSETKT